MSVCPEHGARRVVVSGRSRCPVHRRDENRVASLRYARTEKGRQRATRYNWRRALSRTRARIALKSERVRQLETELGVCIRG